MSGWRRVKLVTAVAIGCVGLLAALGFAVRAVAFLSGAERTEGTVVALAKGDRSRQTPVLSYRVGEKEYKTSAGYSSTDPAHGVGEVVAVLYDPGRPEYSHPSPYTQLWLTPLVLALLGGIFTSAGVAALRRKQPVTTS